MVYGFVVDKTRDLDILVARNARVMRAYRQMRQQDVADRMRERGYQWAQQTVQQVEAGRRPLLLNEAHDLAGVFGTTIPRLTSAAPPL
jgi:transcriptional regulator with XRE-family HTH domain